MERSGEQVFACLPARAKVVPTPRRWQPACYSKHLLSGSPSAFLNLSLIFMTHVVCISRRHVYCCSCAKWRAPHLCFTKQQ